MKDFQQQHWLQKLNYVDLGVHYLIILLLPCMSQQGSPTWVFSHHSDCNVICVSVRLKSHWIHTAFTDKESRLRIWKGWKKALLRKQHEILNLAEPGKTNKQTGNCFLFAFSDKALNAKGPMNEYEGWGNEESSVQVQAVMCWLWHCCTAAQLNPNFQLIQQLYCLDPTAQQHQCDCADCGIWGENNNLNETYGFKLNIWSIKLLKSRVNYHKTHRDGEWNINLTKHAWALTVKPSTAWHQESPHSSTVYHLFSCNHHSLSQLACGEGGVTPWTGASLLQGHTQRQSTTICTHTDAQLKDAS